MSDIQATGSCGVGKRDRKFGEASDFQVMIQAVGNISSEGELTQSMLGRDFPCACRANKRDLPRIAEAFSYRCAEPRAVE